MGDRSGQAGTVTVLAPVRPDVEHELPTALDALQADAGVLAARRDPRDADTDRTHFARFVVLDELPAEPPRNAAEQIGATRLLFTASFDGPLRSYLDDLLRSMSVRRGAAGRSWVDRVWGCCDGFPRSAGMDAAAEYLLRRCIPTTEFIAAYGQASLGDVRRALRLQTRLRDFATTAQAYSDAQRRTAFRAEFPL